MAIEKTRDTIDKVEKVTLKIAPITQSNESEWMRQKERERELLNEVKNGNGS